MATQGMKVFCNILISFVCNVFDQVVHDAAIQAAGLFFCPDWAGLVGKMAYDHGAYDVYRY